MRLRTTILRRVKLTITLMLGVAACVQSPDSAYEFALMGDNPYPTENVPKFRALIQDVNSRASLEWVIHVGDIKPGLAAAEPCSDEVLRGRFELYQGFDVPLIYTPGDNDWFDCVAESAGGYDEYERLAFLRALFFPNPTGTTGGRSMPVRSQSFEPGFEEFVENVLWTRGEVVYATVHLVALSRVPTDPETAGRRLDAAIAWIDGVFELARETGSAAVFIATQVDPWVVAGNPVLVGQRCEACLDRRSGLEPLYSALLQHTSEFTGPVVLAVGDTHIFRVDKPLYRDDGTLVENFTRVETFGHPYVHWVRVTVDPSDRGVFTFHQELVPENVALTGPS